MLTSGAPVSAVHDEGHFRRCYFTFGDVAVVFPLAYPQTHEILKFNVGLVSIEIVINGILSLMQQWNVV